MNNQAQMKFIAPCERKEFLQRFSSWDLASFFCDYHKFIYVESAFVF